MNEAAWSVFVASLLTGPPLAACGWLLWRNFGSPLIRRVNERSSAFARADDPQRPLYRWAAASLAAATYVASLFLPTVAPFNSSFSTTTFPGYTGLLTGLAVFEWRIDEPYWWLLILVWLANPAMWIGMGFLAAGWRRAAGIAAGCGMVLALSTLPWYFSSVALLPGYWAWLGSAGLVLAASVGPWNRPATGLAAADYGEVDRPSNSGDIPGSGEQADHASDSRLADRPSV